MIKNVLRNAQSKAVGIFVKSFVSTEIWKSIMNFNHTVLILNSVPNTLKRLQVLLQVGNWPVGCVCAGYFKQTPKRNKITKFCSVAIPSFGILLQALQRCQSCLFFFSLWQQKGKVIPEHISISVKRPPSGFCQSLQMFDKYIVRR